MRWLLIGTFLVTVWSFVGAADLFTWFFELMLGAAGVLVFLSIGTEDETRLVSNVVASGHTSSNTPGLI